MSFRRFRGGRLPGRPERFSSPFAIHEGCGNGVENAVEVFARILGKESQNGVAMALKERILAAVPPVGLRVTEMLGAVEFDHEARVGAKEVHFHGSVLVEGKGKLRV